MHFKCNVVDSNISGKQFIIKELIDDKGKSTPINKDNVVSFNLFPDGSFVDMRNPPFLSMIPCPWCFTEDNKHHDVFKHIDKRFGKRHLELVLDEADMEDDIEKI